MGHALIILNTESDRKKAAQWVWKAQKGTRVDFKSSKRTLPQNDLLWSLLTQISEQQTYHGMRLQPNDWKLIFLDGLNRELRMVPNLEGTGFVNIGRSSSDLSKEEMTDLIELMFAWGAQNGVTFREQEAA